MKLTDFDTLTFDCYGTLIDWESGMVQGLRSLTGRLQNQPSRDEILQAHARHESMQQAFTPTRPYRDILATVYKRLAEEWRVEAHWADCEAYGDSVKDWPAFPDSAEALTYLKRYYRLVILSNVDNRSFEHSRRKLGVDFDAIYTAEDIGSYKPAPRNFEYMLEKLAGLGVRKERILHTAESLFHDHKPANAAGLKSCWIFRRHAQSGFGATMDPDGMPHVDFRFDSMADLVAAHRAELR